MHKSIYEIYEIYQTFEQRSLNGMQAHHSLLSSGVRQRVRPNSLITILGLTAAASFVFGLASEAQAKTKLENHLKLLPTYYTQDVGKGTTQEQAIVDFTSTFSTKLGSNLRLKLTPYIYSDPVAKSVSERFIFDINEASFNYKAGSFDFNVGGNIIAWGATDFFNPLDVVSARRYPDLLNSQKRATPSIDISWDGGGAYRFEALYVPIQLPSIMPGTQSRWLPRDFTYDRTYSLGRVYLGDQFQYHYDKDHVLDHALNNNFGFRLDRRSDGLDLSAIFFQGTPTAPAIGISQLEAEGLDIRDGQTVIMATDITLQPTYYLKRTVGVSAVKTLESVIVKVALAHTDRVTDDKTLPGWANSAVLGLEKSFSIKSATLTTILQTTYVDNQVMADNTLTSLDRIFDRSFLLGMRLGSGTDWSAIAAILYDSKYAGFYSQVGVDYKIADGVSASLSGGIFDGRPGTPIGTYRRNDRVSAGMEFYF